MLHSFSKKAILPANLREQNVTIKEKVIFLTITRIVGIALGTINLLLAFSLLFANEREINPITPIIPYFLVLIFSTYYSVKRYKR